MACKIERPDATELWDLIASDFSTTVLGGGTIIPESNEHYVVATNYAMAESFYAISEQLLRESNPFTACCENLEDIAGRDGVYRNAAKPAQGYVKITGVAGTAVPVNITFTFGNNVYIPAGSLPAVIPPSGEATISVIAMVPGTAGNTIVSPGTASNIVEGINSEVTAYGQFCNGSPEETCEQFRTRYIDRLKYKPSATFSWIKEKLLEYPCVTDVCELGSECCELDAVGNPVCPDFIRLTVMFRGTFDCGLAPDCVIDELNDWLFGNPRGYGAGQMPFGLCGEVMYTKPSYVDIVIDGLGCETAINQTEVSSRIEDFVSRVCPGESIKIVQLETIIAQVVGNVGTFRVSALVSDVVGNEGINIDNCGNMTVECAHKICLNEIRLVNLTKSTAGCLK